MADSLTFNRGVPQVPNDATAQLMVHGLPILVKLVEYVNHLRSVSAHCLPIFSARVTTCRAHVHVKLAAAQHLAVVAKIAL